MTNRVNEKKRPLCFVVTVSRGYEITRGIQQALEKKLNKNIMTTTAIPKPLFSVLIYSVARAVQIVKQTSMPVVQTRNILRRGTFAMTKAAPNATIQFQMLITPLI